MLENRRLWWFHATFVLLWPALAAGALAIVVLSAIAPSLVTPAVTLGGVLLWGAVIVAAFGSFFGYYEEAKALRETDTEWVPTWWVWAVAHVILTPFVVAPAYLVQRRRKIGLQ